MWYMEWGEKTKYVLGLLGGTQKELKYGRRKKLPKDYDHQAIDPPPGGRDIVL